MTTPRVAILLSTYNGEKYLTPLLESLMAQSYQNFIIVVRDDGSSDGTIELLKNFSSSQSGKIHLVDSSAENLGASASFANLMSYVLENKNTLGLAKATMAFADQDDIWHSNKLEKCLVALEQHQQQHGEIPVLIHSDLRVVADDGELVNQSFASFQGLQPNRNSFPELVLSNLVTGCTALINEPLARLALPINQQSIMHDWWLCLVASAFGEVYYLQESLIDYRQHEKNTIGAKEFKEANWSWLRRKLWVLRKLLRTAPNVHLHDVAKQAKGFKENYQKTLSEQQILVLNLAAKLSSKNIMVQRLVCRKLRRIIRQSSGQKPNR